VAQGCNASDRETKAGCLQNKKARLFSQAVNGGRKIKLGVGALYITHSPLGIVNVFARPALFLDFLLSLLDCDALQQLLIGPLF
jgi:hypothetical protein